MTAPELRAPPLRLLLMEARMVAEFATHFLRVPRDLPRGDGHAVLVIPGFGAGDLETRPLRRVLGKLGYAVYGWEQKRNLGMRPALKEYLRTRLANLAHKHRGRVSLIGWSLGGVFVREMARSQPDLVRRVITLGSPINGRPDANNLMGLFRLINRGKPVNLDLEGFRRRIAAPPVPCTSIYTRSDGIVAWQCCLEEPGANTDCVEVSGSHLGLPYNPETIRAVAERLARPDRPR